MDYRWLWPLWAMLATTTLVGCSGSGSLPATHSGIQGSTTLLFSAGPQQIPPPPPDIRPYPDAVVTVKSARGGPEIARQTSDSAGKFKIALPVGVYLVTPLQRRPDDMTTTPVPQTVTVQSDQFTDLTFQYRLILP